VTNNTILYTISNYNVFPFLVIYFLIIIKLITCSKLIITLPILDFLITILIFIFIFISIFSTITIIFYILY